jgi:DNA-binding protein H-NS
MLDENSNYRGPSIVVKNLNKGRRPESSLDTTDFASMSIDKLQKLHETVEAVLAKKIAAKIIVLERCLQRLGPAANIVQQASQKPAKAADVARRPYPPVLPKYRNPTRPSETWAGRGKQPQWLTMQLESGKQIDDFRIDLAA